MRKHYVDSLRNFGILFLFPFHTARLFNDNPSFYVKGAENTFSSLLVYCSSFWFMPLLFLLAGIAGFHALHSRSAWSFFGERCARLLIPFVFGCLIIVPPQAYYARKFESGHQGSYPEFLTRYFTDLTGWTETTGLSPAHLWFLLYLFLISVALLPVMRAIVRRGYSISWPADLRFVLLPAVVLAALSLLPAPAGQNIFVYGAYFLLGFLIATNDEIMAAIEKHRRITLSIAVAGTIAFLTEIHHLGKQTSPLFALWHHVFFWAALLAILGYGKRYTDGRSRFMDYFGPAAFPVYIVHQTYLVTIAYYTLRIADHGIAPFVIVMLLSFGFSLLTYEVIRRNGTLRFLFGLPRTNRSRTKPGPETPPAPPATAPTETR